MQAERIIALVGFDGVQSLDLTGPMEVFASANLARAEGQPAYRTVLVSSRGGEMVSGSGLRMAGVTALEDLPADADTIMVAGGALDGLVREINETRLVGWLQERARTTRRMASVCSGAFVLAATGLLDGKRATTHWNSCELLAQFRPQVTVEPDAIFVAQPPLYTSAGVTAGIDLSLAMVEEDLGPATALAVARHLVLFMRRPGGQSQFSAGQAVQIASTPKLKTLIAEVAADPTGDLSVPALAARAGMTERTFCRLFSREIGDSPAAFVEGARVDRAKAILETSDWPLARVAERAGFGSLDGLHRAFHRRVGATPGDYRARFGARTA